MPTGHEIIASTPEDTFRIGEEIGRGLKGGELILLTGGLGAGKTVFTKGVMSSLDFDPDEVTSPSFTLVNLYHARLDRSGDKVQEFIARGDMAIDSAVPGYKVRTMALPYGIWPKNRQLAWEGSWTDPKTKQTHTYKFDAVLEVAGGPARSPFDPQFNPHSINRIEAIGNDIAKQLDALDKNKNRFVK